MKLRKTETAAILIALVTVALALGVQMGRRTRSAEFSVTVWQTLSNAEETTERININTADTALLETLPGIGPALAGRIVEHRAENGSFEKCEDIMLVRGIGQLTFERIREMITTGDDEN